MKTGIKEKCTGAGRKVHQWARKNWMKLLIAAEIIVLLLAALSYYNDVTHLASYHFAEEELAAFTKDEFPACFGGTIDENYNGGLYDAFPEVFLEKGYYRYSVTYESSSQGSFCWPHSYVEYHDAFDQAVTYFANGEYENTDGFWLNVDLHMTLRLYYNGTGSVTIREFHIEETPYQANISLFYTVLVLVVLDIIVCVAVYDRKKKIAPQSKYAFVGLVTISIIASIPLLMGHAYNGHDFNFHLTRIEGIKNGLLSGQFPVRINPDFYNGYGYANPIFYGEILLYIPALLRLIGFPLTLCYNIYAIMINLLTCFGCYYCLKGMFGKPLVAMAGAVLYTLAPYRLLDMYIRAAAGEYTAMVFLPFIVYGMYRIYTEDVNSKHYKWCFLPLVVGLSGIIHTHVLTGEMTGGMIILACVLLLFRTFQRKRFRALVKTVLVTIGVNAWFLVPFVDFSLTQDVRVLRAASTDLLQKTGVLLPQLFSQFMHYGWLNEDVSEGIAGEMPLSLGVSLVLGIALCAVMVWVIRKEDGEEQHNRKKQGIVLLILSVIAVAMATAHFPWDSISTRLPRIAHLVASIEFVWRFLAPGTVLAVAATCCGLVLLWNKEGKNACMAAALGLCILTGISGVFFVQECIRNLTPVEMNDLKGMDTAVAATGDEYVLCPTDWYTVTEVLKPRAFDGVAIQDYERMGSNIDITVENDGTEGYVLLPLMNYKGYRVTSDDDVIDNDNLVMGEAAVVRLNIPANYSGTLRVSYGGCWYWRVAELISLVCIASLAVIVLKNKKETK